MKPQITAKELLNNPKYYEEIVNKVYQIILKSSTFVNVYLEGHEVEMIDVDFNGEGRFKEVEEYFEDFAIEYKWICHIYDDAMDMIRDNYRVYGYDNDEFFSYKKDEYYG